MLSAMDHSAKWRSWFVGQKAALLNQLFTHSILRLTVARSAIVPGGALIPGGKNVQWQDLENAGLAFIGTPGKYKFECGKVS